MGRINNAGPPRSNYNGQAAHDDVQVQPDQEYQYDQEIHEATSTATTEDDTSRLVHETYHEDYQQQEPQMAANTLESVETNGGGGVEQEQRPQTQQAEKNPPRSNHAQPKPVQFPPPSPHETTTGPPQGFSPPVQFPIQSPQTIPVQMPPTNNTPQVIAPVHAIFTHVRPQVNQNNISQAPVPTQPWNSGLFDCMKDPTNALVTVCFPCVTFGQIAEIVDKGQPSCDTSGMFYTLFSLIWLPCIMSYTYRTKLRIRYGLVEDSRPDFMIHFFCEYCALCQEYRELQSRGIDPSIGWLANMQQQRQQVAMVPPSNQQMMG